MFNYLSSFVIDSTPPPPIGPCYYQSPIALSSQDVSFAVHQKLKLKGTNTGAHLDMKDKIYEVNPNDKIVLTINNGQRFLLSEYHFHKLGGSEHVLVDGKTKKQTRYDAEVHYVFVADDGKGNNQSTDPAAQPRRRCHICCEEEGNQNHEDGAENPNSIFENYFVIARLITFSDKVKCQDLSKLQVLVPKSYYTYNGALTASSTSHPKNNFNPVKWFVGDKPIYLNAADFNPQNSKSTRPLQSLDGRYLMHSKK